MSILQDINAVNFLPDDSIKTVANFRQNWKLFECTNSNARLAKKAAEENPFLYSPLMKLGVGRAVRSWMRHCATSRKVAGSIPNAVIGIFHLHNPSARTMALGSTQKWVQWIFTGSKSSRCEGLGILPLSWADCLEMWEPQFQAHFRPS